MKPKKIKITINGMNFIIRGKALRTKDYWGKPMTTPEIHIGQVEAASIVKQYVKQKYPEIKVWATSDSYSGGCSTRIYISDWMGEQVSQVVYDDIRKFAKMFQMGRFDGMTDSYEYYDDKYTTDSGTKLDMSVSYVFVDNEPKWDSVEGIIKSLKGWMSGDYTKGTKLTLAEAIDKVKEYHDKLKVKQAVAMLG